ncbi:MAG: DUF2058 family protein [Planctomycetes bacterium]|nr:DUF2058 family protein [Planctomycetota bacterium]
MGNMRDAFRKANLISDKDARRLAHQERVERTEVGRETLEAQARARQEELLQQREADKDRTRRAQEQLERERREEAERAACEDILAREVRRPATGATTRFFFETEDGEIPWLEVGEADRRQIQSGMVSIVRMARPGVHVYGLLTTELARRVALVLPGRIVHAPRGVARPAQG